MGPRPAHEPNCRPTSSARCGRRTRRWFARSWRLSPSPKMRSETASASSPNARSPASNRRPGDDGGRTSNAGGSRPDLWSTPPAFIPRGGAAGGRRQFQDQSARGEYVVFDRTISDLARTCSRPRPRSPRASWCRRRCTATSSSARTRSTSTTRPHRDDRLGLEEIISGARRMVPDLPLQSSITEFAGLSASAGHDFIIGESPALRGLCTPPASSRRGSLPRRRSPRRSPNACARRVSN